MIDLFKLATNIQNQLLKKKWQFCFIGGIALQRWGEPRLTNDIDISLFTGFGNEESYIDYLLKHYHGRIPDAKEFALKTRVLLLQSNNSIGIDISLAGIPFEENVIKRATKYEFLSRIKLLTCSAEDLLIMKAFADRKKDWLDAETIIVRQGDSLDWNYIFKELKPLCDVKESPEIIKKLKKIKSV